MFVEAPGKGWQPGEAGFNQDHFEIWEALEHTFEDDTGEQRLAALGVAAHFLNVEGGPAAGRNRVAAVAEGMNGKRQVGVGACLEDRPVAAPAERFTGAAEKEDLDEIGVARPVLNFLGAFRAIFIRRDD